MSKRGLPNSGASRKCMLHALRWKHRHWLRASRWTDEHQHKTTTHSMQLISKKKKTKNHSEHAWSVQPKQESSTPLPSGLPHVGATLGTRCGRMGRWEVGGKKGDGKKRKSRSRLQSEGKNLMKLNRANRKTEQSQDSQE